MIKAIQSLDQVGMLFLSDLSRQVCSTLHHHQSTSVQCSRFTDGSRRAERFFADNKHTTETGHQMCRARDRTASRVRVKTQQLFAPHRVRGETRRHVSHFTECAEDRIKHVSYSAEYADGPNKGFCTPRSAQETRIRTAQSARTQTCFRQSLPSGDGAIYQDRSTTPKRMTMNDAKNAALFLMG